VGTISEEVGAFFERQRHQLDDPNRNLGRIGNLMLYGDFLEIILRRYVVEAETHHKALTAFSATVLPGSHPLSPEQQGLIATQHAALTVIHLEIETFYLFAKILLDHWSQFLAAWFGEVRGASLHSHDKLVKNVNVFTDRNGLPRIQSELADGMQSMRQRISDYRDYQICHPWTPDGYRGTIGQIDDPYVQIARMGANPNSETPVTMLPVLQEYLQLWIRYVEENVARCRWRQKTE
jgi:hypothetical protein